METRPNGHNSDRQDIHTEVFPCVSSGLAAMPPQVSLTDCFWPFLGSFAVHALLFVILLSPMFQYPIVIRNQAPAIYWFSTMSLPAISKEAEQSLQGRSVAVAAQNEESYHKNPPTVDNPVPVNSPDTVTEIATVPKTPEISVATPVPVIKTIRPERVISPQPVTPTAKTPVTAAIVLKKLTSPLAAEPESHHALAAIEPTMTKPAESQASANEHVLQNKVDPATQHSTEQKQHAAEKLRREQVIREQEMRTIQERAEQDRIAAEKTRQKQLARENELQKQKELAEIIRRQEMERIARATVERNAAVIAAHQNNPVPLPVRKSLAPPAPAQPQMTNRNTISLPIIKGDLKLVIAGSILPDTTIMFKEFAQSRRNRPFSLAESRRNTKIIPLTAQTRDNSREVVIARANPGVYTFTAVPADTPAQVTLSLKLYEGTSRTITRNLGNQIISHKKILFKILMPEGILWDDNSAFSGNMEDSDGVTKFNTDTGLMWKEYAE